jgi:hypothetical protein
MSMKRRQFFRQLFGSGLFVAATPLIHVPKLIDSFKWMSRPEEEAIRTTFMFQYDVHSGLSVDGESVVPWPGYAVFTYVNRSGKWEIETTSTEGGQNRKWASG